MADSKLVHHVSAIKARLERNPTSCLVLANRFFSREVLALEMRDKIQGHIRNEPGKAADTLLESLEKHVAQDPSFLIGIKEILKEEGILTDELDSQVPVANPS